jgi:hypothetical protein
MKLLRHVESKMRVIGASRERDGSRPRAGLKVKK